MLKYLHLLFSFFILVVLSYPSLADTKNDENQFLSNIRQLTFEGKRSGEGYFSQDGASLIFQSERDKANPFYQIYLMELETGDINRVSPGRGKTTCSWIHPEGQKVIFSSTHEDPQALKKQEDEIKLRQSGKKRRYSWDYDEYYDIYESDRRGTYFKNLTKTKGYNAEAAYSPDGKKIVFASNRMAYSQTLSAKEKELFKIDPAYFMEIYIMDADGSNVKQLTKTSGYDGGPFFSADGKKITWRRFSENGAIAEIYTMNSDGTNQRQITRLNAMSWAPYFHPSGDYLIFATNRHGFANFELYLVDVKGKSSPVRVTSTNGFDGLPVFSPDGKKLAWTSNRSANQSQIYMANWNDQWARKQLGIGKYVAKKPLPEIRDTQSTINVSDIKAHINYLASEQLEGRLTGTRGARLATEYGAKVFKRLGLEPAGENGYYQSFDFTAGVSLGAKNQLSFQGNAYSLNQDWRPVTFSKSGVFESGKIVYAGYGLVAPKRPGQDAYNSYTHLDVKDKWVLVFRYLPENITPERRQHLARYANLRYKAMIARDKGAKGLIIMSGPLSKVKNQLVPLTFDASLAGTSLAVISVSDRLGQAILNAKNKVLLAEQSKLSQGQLSMGSTITAPLRATIDIQQQKNKGRNVLARLKAGFFPSGKALMVGAHVDHLGHGQTSNSLAKEQEKGAIHFGADDNASGVAGVFEVAEYLADLKKKGKLNMKRDIIFALWSGEELGLIGANHFVKSLHSAKDKVTAYLNMDMIGRLNKKVVLQGVGSSSIWPKEIERRNIPVGLSIAIQKDSYLPTDATAFYSKGVPILNAFTGAHSDYHTPRDTPDKINYEGAQKISRFMALVARSLVISSKNPDYQAMKKPKSKRRAVMRAYLGTIPDYVGNVKGLKLSGVAKGGPADRAGLKAEDIIIELAGRKIENIYDYTYAIEALKIGEAVEVKVNRAGSIVTLKLVPGSRE